MLHTVGKIAMHMTLTLGSAWLGSVIYCKLSSCLRDTDNNDKYTITVRGVGVSTIVGATLGLGSSIILYNNGLSLFTPPNLHDCPEISELCPGKQSLAETKN